MAAPPSINLLGEIMIFPSVLFFSSYYLISLGFISFLAALYSIYLFTCRQHGGSPKYIKPFSNFRVLGYLLLFLHCTIMMTGPQNPLLDLIRCLATLGTFLFNEDLEFDTR